MKEQMEHKKSTTLTITYVAGVKGIINEEGAMGEILRDLGCPKVEGEEEDNGWYLYVNQNKCHLDDENVMEFLKENCPEVVIKEATKMKVDLDHWGNREHIEKMFEKVVKADVPAVVTTIDWIGSNL